MSFGETVLAEIIGGLASGLIVGFGLYVIFDRFLIKKPKVILYIEPDIINLKDKDSEFILKFYLQNKGNLIAKNIILTAGFSGLNIVKDYPNFKRIDVHRGGTPSIQYNSKDNPLLPIKGRNTYIGEMTFKLREIKEQINIRYDLSAENMDAFGDTYPIKIILEKSKN